MTTPEQPPDPTVDVETPAPTPEDEGAMLAVLLAAIAAYLAARTVVSGPWRNTAAVLDLARIAGGPLARLARRGLTRQAKSAGAKAGGELWVFHEPAATAAVDAGIEHLVRTIYGVQDRMMADAAASAQPDVPRRPPGSSTTDGAAATQAAPGGTTTARRAPSPEPGTPDAARLRARDVITDALATAISRDLADLVLHTATEAAARLTRNWDKTWVTRGDGKVRDAHRHLAGTTIQVLDSFATPEGPIRYPHDPTAAPSLTYNCRCTLRFTYRRKADRARTAALVSTDQRGPGVAVAGDAGAAAGLVRVPANW